ncbi:hypothetical protein OG2516_17156 [Oceanicola granulosus HTCC2516]|uniref:Uncharacterized protein n=2 Tax=Oceanicola granulosus TaxID=252302 RepID=Q2CFL2_OCEGH|nr:hypothetical protein OG2516_17156 [Oceanicola granulosus HTCC2516]
MVPLRASAVPLAFEPVRLPPLLERAELQFRPVTLADIAARPLDAPRPRARHGLRYRIGRVLIRAGELLAEPPRPA